MKLMSVYLKHYRLNSATTRLPVNISLTLEHYGYLLLKYRRDVSFLHTRTGGNLRVEKIRQEFYHTECIIRTNTSDKIFL